MFKTISECLSLQCRQYPDKAALIYKDASISYHSFHRAATMVARGLLSAGLRKYDRCAIYMEKRPEEAQAIFGINMAGGLFIDINHLLKQRQVKHILIDSGTRFLFTTSSRLQYIVKEVNELKSLEAIILVDYQEDIKGLEKSVIPLQGSGIDSSFIISGTFIETDPAAIIYTSGSTGKPKGVVVSQRNLVAGAESVTAYVANSPDDRILSVLPFSFDYGLNQLTSSVFIGCTCVLINYLLINDVVKAVKNHSITGLGLIPPLWMQLLQKKWDHSTFQSLRYITNTGGAMPEPAVRELRKRLPATDIYLMFGLTEAFRGTFLDPDLVDEKPTSIGKAIPNAEIWILNENLEHCKPFEEGELVQRGAHVALGYWNDPEKTAQYFKPNPLIPKELQVKDMVVFSGDTVYQDEDGDIYYKYRKDDMIKSSGYRISPTEIEDVLYQSGYIKHAVVFGIPEPDLGQKICGVVSLKKDNDVTSKEILSFCASILPNYMIPEQIIIIAELPLNHNGKIDRNALKKEYGHEK